MQRASTRQIILKERIAALTPRERAFVGVGAVCAILFLLYLLVWRDNGDQSASVELADTPPLPIVAAPVQPVGPPPSAPPPLPSAMPVQVAAASTMTLQGVSGGGPGGGAALIQYQDGNQRLVRVGREIAPGTVLKSVGLSWAIASSASGDIRLDLGRSGATPVIAQPAAPAGAAPITSAPQAQARETMELRLGLQPVSSGGRRGGYLVKDGAQAAVLAPAGLRPGDVITAVNGSALDEERLLELSWQMSNSQAVVLDVMRGGKPLKLTLKPDQLR